MTTACKGIPIRIHAELAGDWDDGIDGSAGEFTENAGRASLLPDCSISRLKVWMKLATVL